MKQQKMKIRNGFFTLLLLFLGSIPIEAQVQQQNIVFPTTTLHQIDGIAWASNMGTNLVTGSEYWVYINPSLQAVVAKKSKTGTITTKVLMDNVPNNDNHAEFSLGVDNDGYIHIMGGAHNSVPFYFVSSTPDDISNFDTRTNDLETGGIQGTQVTYQTFSRSNKGTLFVTYRNNLVEDFVTGARSIALARYNTKTKKWTMIGGKNYQLNNASCTTITGEQAGITAFIWNNSGVGDMRPPSGKCFSQAHYQGYQLKIVFDQNNKMHLSYNMADSINMSSGQDVSRFMTHLFYATSPDEGETWFKANGQQITTFPITKATGDLVYKCYPAGYVYPAVTSTQTMTNSSSIMLDKDGVPMLLQFDFIANKTRMFRSNGTKWEDKSSAYSYPNDKLFTNLTKKEVYNFGSAQQFQISIDNMATWKNNVTMTKPCTWYVVVDQFYLTKTGNVKYYARDETNKNATIMTMLTSSPDSQAPDAPLSLVSSEHSQNGFTASWNAVANLDVCRYDVYVNNAFIGSTGCCYYQLKGLNPLTAYSITVKAVDASNNASAASAILAVNTIGTDTTVPTSPSNLQTSNITANAIRLSWNAASDNVAVVSYEIYKNGTWLASTITNAYNVTSLQGGTTYIFSVKAKDAAGNMSSEASKSAQTYGAGLIVYESFNYNIGETNLDPDNGVNGGNGLPATNSGGNPSATSTGIRGAYGTVINAVAGLNYAGLQTLGGAGLVTNASWGNDLYLYRFMTTDPFMTNRIGDNQSAFGKDGQTLYLSFLAKTSSATAQAFRLKISGASGTNIYIENTATNWTLNNANTTVASMASLELNKPTLIVLKFEFTAGATDKVSLYKNPTIGAGLPSTADAVLLNQDIPGIITFNTRPAVANTMTLDELRIGLSLSDVLPVSTTLTAVNNTTVNFSAYHSASNMVLDLTKLSGNQLIEVFNVQGRMLYKFNAIGGQFNTFNCNLKQGVYLVKVSNVVKANVVKFIVN